MALPESAWLEAYRRLERPLFNVLYRSLWQRQDAEDLMHEAFLRVWDRRESVRVEGLDALLYTTALNLARNRLRWRELWRFVGFEADDQAPDDPLLDADGRQAESRLRQALNELTVEQRNVMLLAEYAGMTTDEIAKVLHIAPGTVGSRKHAAKQRLRALLGEPHD